MPNPKPVPPKQELEALYIVEGLSVYSLSGRFGVAEGTVRSWLKKYEIPIRNKQEQFAVNDAKARKAAEAQHAQFEFVDEAKASPQDERDGSSGDSPQPLACPTPIASAKASAASFDDENDDVTPFQQLSRREQALAVAYSESLIANDDATQEQIAERARCSADMLQRCLKEQTFQDAVRELTNPQFHFHGEMGLRQYALEKIQSKKVRPEELKTFAEIFGLIGPGGTNVNINLGTVYSNQKFKRF